MNMLRNRIGFVTVTPTVLPPYHAVVLETHVIMQTHRLYFCVPSFVTQRQRCKVIHSLRRERIQMDKNMNVIKEKNNLKNERQAK
jgi:hypothetical protein